MICPFDLIRQFLCHSSLAAAFWLCKPILCASALQRDSFTVAYNDPAAVQLSHVPTEPQAKSKMLPAKIRGGSNSSWEAEYGSFTSSHGSSSAWAILVKGWRNLHGAALSREQL